MIIVLNPFAAGGKARHKWRRIERSVLEKRPHTELFILNGKTSISRFIARKIQQGHREFVAAGGDGTVNLLVQELLKPKNPVLSDEIKLGALGLGSSNDFHKPFRDDCFLGSVPCKMDFNSAVRQDVGLLLFEDEQGKSQKKYWLNNASVGLTAEANHFFNYPDLILTQLKKYATNPAILYAALHTIFTYKNKKMKLRFGQEASKQVTVTNLGVVLNPHFSGSFCYDSPYEGNSGYFYAHLCHDMTLIQTVRTLYHLSRSEFSGLPNTMTFRVNYLNVRAEEPFAVEFDGEIILTRQAEFSVMKKLMQVCQR